MLTDVQKHAKCCTFLQVLAEGDCEFSPFIQAMSSVCERLLDAVPKSSFEFHRSALFGSLESAFLLLRVCVSHAVAQWGRLWTQQQQLLKTETEAEKPAEELSATELAKVAGNLQSKFELAASVVDPAGDRASAKPTCNKTSTDSSRDNKVPDRMACRVVSAIKSPYLSESQRQTLWGAKKGESFYLLDASQELSRTKQRMERIQQCLRHYANLLEEAICVMSVQTSTMDAHSRLTCLTELLRSWGSFYAVLTAQPAEAVKNLSASLEAAPRKLLERVVHLLLAKNTPTGVLVTIEDRKRVERSVEIRNTVVTALQAFLICSNRYKWRLFYLFCSFPGYFTFPNHSLRSLFSCFPQRVCIPVYT